MRNLSNKRKWLIILTLPFNVSLIHSQTFIDDFEFYTPGSFLAASSSSWGTWNNQPGGAEDVTISTANASSGSNSIYFSSNLPSGGPDDIILPFPIIYTTGTMTLEANFFIENGKGAYFNLQETTVPGQAWALDVFLNQDGDAILRSNFSILAAYSSIIPIGQWFNLKLSMDLTNNTTELIINNISYGPIPINNVGSVGMLDIYAYNGGPSSGGNNIAGFYIDDISYDHTVTSVVDHDSRKNLFSLFPNPSKGSFSIKIDDSHLNPFSLTITDMGGRLVWQEKLILKDHSELNFPEDFLTKGIYLVSIEANGNIDHIKLVIQ